MYTLFHLEETITCQDFSLLPLIIQENIREILDILDDCYGATRNGLEDPGGYVMVLESIDDIEALKDNIMVNLKVETFEYVIQASGYLCSLLILGSEYHIYFVLPQSLAPIQMLNQIDP